MSDIYHIPGDDGKTYRLKKFVEYQHEVPSLHYRFLGEWIKRHNLDTDAALNASYLMSETYNEITCVLLMDLMQTMPAEDIWARYRDRLNFGSARKYAKANDLFPSLWRDWLTETESNPGAWLRRYCGGDALQNYINVQTRIQSIKNVGRFAADLFMEMVVYLADYIGVAVKEPLTLDWKNCANLTSGIYNIFYEDERANLFDKTKNVTKQEQAYLASRLQIIQHEIQHTYPEQDAEISMFIGKICSFRNLFKNARYGGFHHDRQLGVLREYEKAFPDKNELWERCYALRREIFPERFLGELNGWDGIRKERKKIWLTTGKTGVEI